MERLTKGDPPREGRPTADHGSAAVKTNHGKSRFLLLLDSTIPRSYGRCDVRNGWKADIRGTLVYPSIAVTNIADSDLIRHHSLGDAKRLVTMNADRDGRV
jgi:hypothetical protein